MSRKKLMVKSKTSFSRPQVIIFLSVVAMEDENEVVGHMNVTVSIVQALKKVQNLRRLQS